MMVLTVDVTPWAIIATALGVLFGALVKRPLYGVFAVLATFFGSYSLTPIFGMPYNVFATVSWLLSAFFGASSMSNLVATWVRRIETQLQMLAREMETLKLMIEEDR